MNKFFAAFISTILSNTALAAGYLTDFNGPGVTITKYFVHGGGGITLRISGSVSNPDNCDNINQVHIKGDLPGHEYMQSATLAAFAAGKKVGLYSNGCETIPFWGGTTTYPIVSNLWVVN